MKNGLFPKNVHAFERVFRALLGIFVLSLVFWGPQSLWGLLGIVPLLTAFAGTCPLYTLFGLSTCKKCEAGARPIGHP